ncbi:hypothetical protein HDU91_001305 [Kappamyces sp. JEL0680]|nr:hypothetical protein HDU91_001305 [Kappamyces sp. JEL0680]
MYTILALFIAAATAQGLDLNLCKGTNELPTMNFGTGFAGSANAQEFRFKPLNEAKFPGQSTALDGKIIARFLCDKVQDTCKAPAATVDKCRTDATNLFISKFDIAKKGTAANGGAADAWNGFWGLTTNFASGQAAGGQATGGQAAGGQAAGGQAAGGQAAGGQAAGGGSQQQNSGTKTGNNNVVTITQTVTTCNAAATNAAANPPAANNPQPQAAGCGFQKLQVIVKGEEHRFGLGDSQVALRAQIPVQRICDRATGGAACQSKCTAAGQAIANAIGFTGANDDAKLLAMGVAADQFNAAIGLQSNFASKPIFQ